MKKLLLTLMLAVVSTALVWGGTTPLRGAELLKEASGELSLPQSVKAETPRTGFRKAALPGIAATAGRKLPATGDPRVHFQPDPFAPAMKAKAPAMRTEEENVEWGEWYKFNEGTVTSDNSYGFGVFFGLEFPRKVTLMRRDAADNSSLSQLWFDGFFEDYDFIINYNPESGVYWWNRFYFDHTENPYDAVVPYFIERSEAQHEAGGYVYNPKMPMSLDLFIICIGDNMGYQSFCYFIPDNLPDSSFAGSLETTDSQNGTIEFGINSVGADVATVRYGIFYTADGTVFDGENGRVSVSGLVKANREDYGVVSVARDEIAYHTTFTADKSGAWYVCALLYDDEGDHIGTRTGYARVGLSEPGKWIDAGVATYTDGQLYDFFQNYLLNEAEGYVTNLQIPDWGRSVNTWEVPVQQNVENPDMYRLVNPYTCANAPFSDCVVSYDDNMGNHTEFPLVFDRENEYYLIIDRTNPNGVLIYTTPMGITEDNVYSWTFDYRTGADNSLQCVPAHMRNYNIFNYDPNGCISSQAPAYPYRIVFPGYVDYNIEFSTTWTTMVLSHMGEGVAKVAYTFCKTGEEPEDIWQLLADKSETITIAETTEPGAVDLMPFGLEQETCRYTIFAVAYDAQGNMCSSGAQDFVPYKHEYEFFSTALLREATIESACGLPSEFYEVEVYTAPDAEGHYYVYNPYRVHPYLAGNYIGEIETFVDIDCSDPLRVNIPEYEVPIELGVGALTFQSISNYYMTHGNSADAVADAGYFGTFCSGQIVLPLRGTLFGYGGSYYYGSSDDSFAVRFPWYVDYAFKLTATVSSVEVSEIGNGVSEIVFTVVEKDSMSETEIVDGIYNGSVETHAITEEGPLPLEYFTLEPGTTYVVVALSKDESGEYREVRSVEFTPEPPYELAGVGTYTDAYIQLLFNLDGLEELIEPREVEVYTLNGANDVVYVKEPFTTVLENAGFPYIGSRYLPIDISDPSRVFVPGGAIGIMANSEEYWCTSFAELYRNEGFAEEEIPDEAFGKLTEGKVVIPATALVFGNSAITEDRLGEVPNAALELVLPASMTGVKDVEATRTIESPAEYFDLSGRRVDKPSSGLYIVRRGATVSKEIIR